MTSVPMTPRFKQALAFANRAAILLKDNYVGIEHLAYGVVKTLAYKGAGEIPAEVTERVRRLILEALSTPGDQAVQQQQDQSPQPPAKAPNGNVSGAQSTAPEIVQKKIPIVGPGVSLPPQVPSDAPATGASLPSTGAKSYRLHLSPVPSCAEMDSIIRFYDMPLQEFLDLLANYRISKERP